MYRKGMMNEEEGGKQGGRERERGGGEGTSKSLLMLTVLTSLSKWTVMEAPRGTSTSPFFGAFCMMWF